MLVSCLELNLIKKTVFVPSFLLDLRGCRRECYGFKVLDFGIGLWCVLGKFWLFFICDCGAFGFKDKV